MKTIIIVSAMFGMLSASMAHAKRSVPKEVTPVVSGAIEYRAPRDQMGCVEAWQGDDLVWRRQIYVVKYYIPLERDIQDSFITTIELKNNILIVKNERESEYHLDLTSMEVKVIKGSLIQTLDKAREIELREFGRGEPQGVR